MDPMTVLALLADLYAQLLGVTETNKRLSAELEELKATSTGD